MPQQHQIKALASLKFGGTSMGSAASILECAQIIEDQSKNKRCIVTVSAVSGVTNQLLSMLSLPKSKSRDLW